MLALRGQEQLDELRVASQFTAPRKQRLLRKPVHRRVLTVRGAYRLAQKRGLGLGGGRPSCVGSRAAIRSEPRRVMVVTGGLLAVAPAVLVNCSVGCCLLFALGSQSQ